MDNLRRPHLIILLLLVPLALVAALGYEAYRVFATVPIYLATLFLLIPLHEGGHALIGATMGLRISRIVVGKGRIIMRRRIGGVMWELGLIPLGGLTVAAPFDGSRFLRGRLWLFALGGPLVDAAVTWLAWRLGARFQDHATLHSVFSTAAWAAGTQLVFDLFPHQVNVNGVFLGSDGRQLLSIPFMKPAEIKALYASHYVLGGAELGLADDHAGALAWFERGLARYPEDAALGLHRALALHRLHRDDEALAAAAALLAKEESVPRTIALNDWSWYAFHRGDDRNLRRADQRSAEAVSRLPGMAPVAGTRGAVLLWQGRVAEAVPLLRRGFDGTESKQGRATDGCLLATAYAALGDGARAHKYLEAARAANPECDLLPGAEAAVGAMGPGPRQLAAERGHRVLVIRDDELELVGAGAGPPGRVRFQDVKTVEVGLTARGAGQLVIQFPGGRWRVSLHPGALGSARIALHALISRQPAPPVPPAHQQTARRHSLRPAGLIIGTAASVAFIAGRFQADQAYADIMAWVLAVIVCFAPGPGPLLGFGTAAALQVFADFTGLPGGGVVGGAALFWSLTLGVIGALALGVGWSARQTGPEGRKQGLRVTVGVLIFLMLPGAGTLVTVFLKGLTMPRLMAATEQVGPFGVGAVSLAVVLLAVGRARFRAPGALLGVVGVACVVVCSGPFHERVVLSPLGPPPAALVWTSRPAKVVRRQQIPDGAWGINVSPSGLAWVASAPKSHEAPAQDAGADGGGSGDDDDDDSDSPAQARAAKLVVGDFAGQVHTVPGYAARFIDDQRLLILSRQGDEWQAREVLARAPGETRRVATVPTSGRPMIYRDEPAGTIVVASRFDGESKPRYRSTWASERGLEPSADEVARGIELVDDGRVIYANTHLLTCPGWQMPGRLFCVPGGVQPVQLMIFDVQARTAHRVASIAAAHSDINVMSDGRVAIVVRGQMVVIDPAKHTATTLSLEADSGGTTQSLVRGNLAMAIRQYQGGTLRTDVAVLAPP